MSQVKAFVPNSIDINKTNTMNVYVWFEQLYIKLSRTLFRVINYPKSIY